MMVGNLSIGKLIIWSSSASLREVRFSLGLPMHTSVKCCRSSLVLHPNSIALLLAFRILSAITEPRVWAEVLGSSALTSSTFTTSASVL